MPIDPPITTRSSSMRLAVICPASASAERPVLVDSFDATATDGSDVHRAIALKLAEKEYPPFDGDNAADNEAMTDLAIAWFDSNIRPLYPNVQTERRLYHDFVAGTIDVLVLAATRAVVVDWKTTYREDDHSSQLYSYAYLVFTNHPKILEVEIFTAYLRGEDVVRKVLSRDWILAWAAEVKHNIIDHPEIHRTGEHCLRCPRRIGCKAVIETNRQTVQELTTANNGLGLSMTREIVRTLKPRVKLLEATIKAFNEFVREDVIANGPIQMDEGKELRAITMHFDHIDIVRAWPILQAEFSDNEMGEFVEVGKTKLLKAIASKVEKGKGKAQDALMDRLKMAMAVTTTEGIQVRELAQQ